MHQARNDEHPSRRDFLKSAGVASAVCLAGLAEGATPRGAQAAENNAEKRKRPLKLALASYTLRKFDLDQTLAMTARVGLEAICLKSFHLPLDATDDEIAAARAKVEDAGILLYGGGVIGLKSPEEVDRAFEYAKAAGMVKIIGAPTAEMLPLVDRKVRQYDIEVCIHNHGPGDKHFPTPEAAYEKIKTLDRRIGICHDVGHTLRYGVDPIVSTRKYADRMLDIHIKDITEATARGGPTVCGRGVIDLPALLRTLIEIDYRGYVSFEYEESADDPLPGLAESVGYVRGVLDALG